MSDIAQQNGGMIAAPVAVVVFDSSYSMNTADAKDPANREGISRYAAGCLQLARLQEQMPGQIAILSFHDIAQMNPDGVPMRPGGCTNLTLALKMAKQADNGSIRFIVISDGDPDDEQSALNLATTFQGPIDTISIGTYQHGANFLRRLAQVGGGQYHADAETLELAETVQRFLLTG
jgi:hypothetical protein